MTTRKAVTQAALALAVLAAGLLGAYALFASRPRAERTQPAPPVPLVRVATAEPVSYRVTVAAMGTVVPAREVALFPEVPGRIVELSPRLIPGGVFREGETLLRIDPRDYRIAVKQQEAAVERARLELRLEEGRRMIAEREWGLLEADIPDTPENRELALREPHRRNAAAALAAAEAALELARINLERTVVKAPFNAVVQEEFVDVGQVVSPQTRLATLVGTDRFWVQVSIPVDRLRWIDLSEGGKHAAPDVRVVHKAGADLAIVRKGRLLKLLGDLDPAGRMARVLVSVEDPLGLRDGAGAGGPGLLLGAYVRVEIRGAVLDEVFVLPRTAVSEGDRVWVMDPDDTLRFRDVRIPWRTEDEVVVSEGLRPGERVVLTRLASPIPGMKLRHRGEAAGGGEEPTTATP